ncbi:TrkA C-terminal domain-containing protein [Thermanaeromonas sp. C210]|uniref:TrkA C-terminal domain-containing protein n=1 Tax=Thermanaeromonas sp. C210 TaxID=2731925 RepID=UPI00155B4D7A|nr:TrkA C-terminal domain-containing protein [Thermanaeromonas sp. C210]GFN23924.1 GntR family transcriptional regulator [Thermanaeromonas sp. C210]
MEQGQGWTSSARYVAIASDLAARIARGEYKEGEKVLGRSSLAGRYSVSPETIRRAVSLLEEMGVVQVIAGVGVVVKSREAAKAYLARVGEHHALQEIQERLSVLLREKSKLETEINRLLEELLDYTFRASMRLQKIHEISIPSTSPLVGKTLASSEFRARTGATVVGIQRDNRIIFSPGAETPICAGDLLIIVAPDEVKERVSSYVAGTLVEDKGFGSFFDPGGTDTCVN